MDISDTGGDSDNDGGDTPPGTEAESEPEATQEMDMTSGR